MIHSTFPHLKQEVSRLGFGAFGLGGAFGACDEKEGIEALHFCWEQGVNFVDTARAYGPSEEIIARALKSWSGPRPFIASKVRPMAQGIVWAMPQPVEECFPRGHITRDVEASLRALGVDALDLAQLHIYWPNWGVEGYWLDELNALHDAGKIRSIGVSMPDQRHDAALPLVVSGRIHSVQAVFNIFDPTPLDCLIPLCREHGVAVIARCVLDEGGLTGTLRMDTTFGASDFRAKYFDCGPRRVYIEKVDALRKFVPKEAGSLAALAFKFVLHDPGVTTAVCSMHLKPFAEQNIRAVAEPPLSEEAFDEIRRHHRWIRNFYGQKVL